MEVRPVISITVGDKTIFSSELAGHIWHTGDALEILQAKYSLEEAVKKFDGVLMGIAHGANRVPGPDQGS